MQAEDLIRQLKKELAIPSTDPAGEYPVVSVCEGPEWRELQRCVRLLREAAESVGVRPVGYPLHVDLTMRIVGALLPWYTRPLRAQAEACVALSAALENVLERLAERQEEIDERLRRLETGNGNEA